MSDLDSLSLSNCTVSGTSPFFPSFLLQSICDPMPIPFSLSHQILYGVGSDALIAPGPVGAYEWRGCWRFASFYTQGISKCRYLLPSSLPGHSREWGGGTELFFTQEKKAAYRLPLTTHTCSQLPSSSLQPLPESEALACLKHPPALQGGWAGRGVILGAASEIQWPC